MKPVVGLAPMDGITDCAFREITDKYGHPDLLYTEFVPVEAIAHGVTRVMPALRRHKTSTPSIAQFFGRDLKSFYKSAFIAAEMGYDGIDINMGCPDRNIAKKGGGGGLIGEPELALAIIRTVKLAVKDWSEGKTLTQARVPDPIIDWIKQYAVSPGKPRLLPVSVKTRTGLDKPITKEWISTLLSAKPDQITLHGRTLVQLYRGKADWNEIGEAARLAKKAGVKFFGNGDIESKNQAYEYAAQYGCDGILIGRASLGNPWLFAEHAASVEERRRVMMEHAVLFLKYRPELKLYPMRKHLAWYCTGFEHSKSLRPRLMEVSTVKDLQTVLRSLPA